MAEQSIPPLVRRELIDGVAVVTLNRPEARNALSIAMIDELATVLRAADRDPAVRCIVLTGAEPAFCAGIDLRELAGGARTGDAATGYPWPVFETPSIAAVNGAAVAGGLELALLCDIVVAGDRAVFADAHARVGVLPAWGLSVRLPQRVGLSRALQMSLTATTVSAAEALSWGLVDRVAPHGELLDVVVQMARSVADLDPDLARQLRASMRAVSRIADEAEALRVAGEDARQWRRTGFEAKRVPEPTHLRAAPPSTAST